MTQYDFIKKFLPDHEEKLKQLIPDFDSQSGNMEYLSIMDFCDIYFEEALKSFIKDGLFQLPLSCLGGMLIGVGIGTSILVQRPTVLDFMRGKVDVNIQETYVDSILVKRDTIITYKNKMPLSCP